jgi:hypothetical protein
LFIIVILPDDGRRSIEQNFRIIRALQGQVEGPVSSGVYDGRKNFFTSSDPEFESDAQEVSLSSQGTYPLAGLLARLQFVVVVGAEFRVRLTRVDAEPINTEYGSFRCYGIDEHLFDSRVLLRFVNGEQSHNNDVLMAITVREFAPHFEAVRNLRSGVEYCRPYGTKSPLPFKQEFLLPDPRTKTYWRGNGVMARILSICAARNWPHAD